MTDSSGILSGRLVIDASSVIAGSYASLMMADFGARVIKIEHPKFGDGARHLGTGDTTRGMWWKFLSRNKECITCDLSSPEGADIVRRLAAKADILIENFRPGTMEKWGLGYEALSKVNVGLVMLRISGFGQDGPYSALPGYGTLLEAMTGLAHMSGELDGPPMLPGFPTADTVTGLVAFGACMTALWGRDRQGGSGTGTVVDASLYGPLLYLLGSHFVEAAETGRSPGRQGNHQGNTPRNAVQCSDGKWLAYSAQSFKVIRGLVEILNLEHDERFNDPACGYLYGNELDRKTVEHVKGMERSAAMAELQAHGVPVAPINDLVEVMNDVHMRARSEFNPVRDRSRPGKTVLMPTSPVRLRNSPGVVGFTGARLGEDTASVLSELLGITGPEMERLRRAGVI